MGDRTSAWLVLQSPHGGLVMVTSWFLAMMFVVFCLAFIAHAGRRVGLA